MSARSRSVHRGRFDLDPIPRGGNSVQEDDEHHRGPRACRRIGCLWQRQRVRRLGRLWRHHDGLRPGRRRERLADGEHQVDPGVRQGPPGSTLKFSDAQQKQENQIKAIRSYIQQKVDVIAFSPVVETGWDTVLHGGQARQHPGHPHRPRGRLRGHLALQDLPRLRLRRGGQEGRRVAGRRRRERRGRPVNVVELQGTTGAAPAIDRKEGFADGDQGSPDRSRSSRPRPVTSPASGGKQVMEAFLKSNPDIDVVYRPQRRHGSRRDRGHRGGRQGARQGHQDHHRRRGQGRHAGPGRRQDQLHRRVQPAARPAADGPGKKVLAGEEVPNRS